MDLKRYNEKTITVNLNASDFQWNLENSHKLDSEKLDYTIPQKQNEIIEIEKFTSNFDYNFKSPYEEILEIYNKNDIRYDSNISELKNSK